MKGILGGTFDVSSHAPGDGSDQDQVQYCALAFYFWEVKTHLTEPNFKKKKKGKKTELSFDYRQQIN